jgi:AcrR family transcriptional regulator
MPVAKGTSLDPGRTRAAVLGTATRILYARGLDGVGVAELCSAAGISKETLYRHFGSKDGLVHAMLEQRSERVSSWLERAVAAAGDAPEDQLAAVFDALGAWYAEPGFRGCAISNAAAQRHAQPVDPVAGGHLTRRRRLLTGIAERAGAADPAALGRQLTQLVSGATSVADLDRDPSAAADAREAALALLRAATRA